MVLRDPNSVIFPEDSDISIDRKIIVKNRFMGFAGVVTYISGILLDHLTTMYGLGLPGVVEKNSVVIALMELNLWHFVDFMNIVVCIFSFVLIIKSKSKNGVFLSSILFAGAGLFRIYTGIMNISIIISILI